MHSDDYQRQLQTVHASRSENKRWGTTGARNFGEYVKKYIDDRNGWIESVLDFGAGQQTLGSFVLSNARTVVKWTDYDPGIPALCSPAKLDGKYDLVVSSDVLEHVEPDQVQATLAQLRNCAVKAQYHHIACEPCGLILPDGRNAHLSVYEPEQWMEWLAVDGWSVQYWCRELERKRGGLRLACKILLEKQ